MGDLTGGNRRPGGGMGGYIAGGLFFFALGLFIYLRRRKWLATVRQQVAAAQHWPEANARVDDAEVYIKPSWLDALALAGFRFGNRMPTMAITYRFEVDGQIYQGNRLAFGRLDTIWKHARQLLEPYPKGSVTRIRYNPRDPRDNVVVPRELVSAKQYGVVGPMIMAFGPILMLVGLAKGH